MLTIIIMTARINLHKSQINKCKMYLFIHTVHNSRYVNCRSVPSFIQFLNVNNIPHRDFLHKILVAIKLLCTKELFYDKN